MILEVLIILVAMVAFIHFGQRVAPYIGLIDHPSEARKKHKNATPAIGGAVIFIVFTLSLLIFLPMLSNIYSTLLAGMGAYVVLGVRDDIKHIRAHKKMLLQIVIALFFVAGAKMEIHLLGNIFGMGDIGTRWAAFPFTVLCIIVLINAINWIDGLDGLAGGVLFSILGLLFYSTYGSVITPIIIILMATIAGFLLFNIRTMFRAKAAIFLGDAGSLGLGFALSWIVIYLTQIEVTHQLTPMVAVWIISYPIFDMISSMINRTLNKTPLHSADNMHMHFLIQNLGISVQNSSYILITTSTLYGLIGIFAHRFGLPEFGLTFLWCVTLCIHFGVFRWLSISGLSTKNIN